MRIVVRYKDFKVDLELNHKITVIVGDSASGKSTLWKVMNTRKQFAKLKIDDGFRLVSVNSELYDAEILSGAHAIYIIDENINIDSDVARHIKETTDAYFIIMQREPPKTLNYDINAVKKLVRCADGYTRLSDFVTLDPIGVRSPSSIRSVLIEDSRDGKYWTEQLFSKSEISVHTSFGKDAFVDSVVDLISSTSDSVSTVLLLCDVASFGCQAMKLKSSIAPFGGRMVIIPNYKSWEYVILESNMFAGRYVEYSINIPDFEESYYEKELSRVSNSKYGTISHASGKQLSSCYTKPCCCYVGKANNDCKFGISGPDKFVAMLKGTKFDLLLQLAGRL